MKRNRCPNTNGKLLLAGVLSCLFVISMLSNAAALMVSMSIEEITRKADLVIIGEVRDVKAYRTKDQRFINSIATVRVEDVIKGEVSSQNITVEYPGGIVDGIGMTIDDWTWLYKGDRVLLLLRSYKSEIFDYDTFFMVGAWQGTFKIDENDIARGSGFEIINGEEKLFGNLPVDELIEKIRSVE